jgi:hypothetical protein
MDIDLVLVLNRQPMVSMRDNGVMELNVARAR